MHTITDAYAQQSDQKTLASIIESPAEKQGGEIKLGNYVFHPDITLALLHDDNIYSTSTDEKNDTVSSLYAELNFDSDWDRHLLDLKLGIDANRYASFESENTIDSWLSVKGRYDLDNRSSLKFSAGYYKDHEDRASPEAIFGKEPTEITENRYTAGFDKAFNDHSLTVAAISENQDYHDVTTSTGTINNDTRDMTMNSIGLRFNYSFTKGYYLFATFSQETRDYDQPFDLNNFNRDSDIENRILGLKYNNDKSLYGDIFAGRLKQEFDDNQFEQVNKPDFGTHINWHPSNSSKLVIIVDRSVEETTLNNASSFVYDQYYLKFSHSLTQYWSYYLNAVQATADYQLIARTDDYNDYAIGANYQLLKDLTFGMDYVYLQRDSNIDADDYSSNQIYIRVTALI